MKRLLAAAATLGITAILVGGPSFGSAQSSPAWITFHGNPTRDGQSSVSGPTTKMEVGAWSLPKPVESSPVVDSKGNAYIGDNDGRVYALATANPGKVQPGATTIRWSVDTGGPVKAAPSLTPDGSKLFVGSESGMVFGLNTADGSKLWSLDLGGPIDGSPLPSPDGSTVFVSNINGTIHALSTATGSEKWKLDTNIAIRGSLALSPDGSTLYAAFTTGIINGFNASGPSGTNKASVTLYLSGPPVSSPSVDTNGNIYITTAYGTVDSFAAGGGNARWSFIIPNHTPASSTPALASGNVYFGAGNGNLYAISQSSGQQVWALKTNAPIESSPAVATGNGLVYVGSDDGTLYAFNASAGTLAWSRFLGGVLTSSPALAQDGSLWMGSQGNGVYRFLDVGPPATLPIPSTNTPGPSPTPAATSTAGPTLTATAGGATATPTTSATSTAPSLKVTAKSSVKPGAKQVIAVTTAPGVQVRVRVNYPNGDHQSKSLTSNASGKVTYSYKQGGSKITHSNSKATIVVKAGTAPAEATQTVPYTIKFGAIDVSAEPRTVAAGKVVNIYVHAARGAGVVASIQIPRRSPASFRGRTGSKGFAHFKFTVPKGAVGHGKKIAVYAQLTNGGSSTGTNFTVK